MTRLDQLYELQHRLSEFQIYRSSEIDAVAETRDPAGLGRLLDPVADRFRGLYEPAQEEFRNALSAFIRLYSFLTQEHPISDPDLESLYTFGRLLLPRLPSPSERDELAVAEEAALGSYGSKSEAKEVDLLRNIHRRLPVAMAERYRMLMEKRRAETLTDTEHAELIRLTDESELLQAERVESLAALAHLRRISLTKLAEDLSFQPRLFA